MLPFAIFLLIPISPHAIPPLIPCKYWLQDPFLLSRKYSTNRLSHATACVSLRQSEYLVTRSLDSSMVLNATWRGRCSGRLSSCSGCDKEFFQVSSNADS
ncbi:unnamed protein product [Macrosiphum euphorbiae]|uniref:Secreted protein n=1 Tax=Macrosiphum euphorbiae TaxID=13131 RepID=A0AAV0WEE1_9HEMI|nr:unnamed protein product [Macrosiphum euphorbiae]